MKTLKIVLTSVFLLLTLTMYIACSDENDKSALSNELSLEKDTQKINSLLKLATPLLSNKATSLKSKMRNKEEKETLLITFLVVKNKTTGEIALTNFKKDSYFPISGKNEYAKEQLGDKRYVVSCSAGGKTTTSTCSSKWMCGKAIVKCLDKGGCATICAAPDKLIKSNDRDFLGTKISELDINDKDAYTSVELSFIPSLIP